MRNVTAKEIARTRRARTFDDVARQGRDAEDAVREVVLASPIEEK